jgi:hypothetical protein
MPILPIPRLTNESVTEVLHGTAAHKALKHAFCAEMTQAHDPQVSANLQPCLYGAYRTALVSLVSQSPNQATVAPQPFKDTGPAVLPNNWPISNRPSRGDTQVKAQDATPARSAVVSMSYGPRACVRPTTSAGGFVRATHKAPDSYSHSAPTGCAFARSQGRVFYSGAA